MLAECSDLLLLDGWQYSAGAQVDREDAVLFKMGIFDSVEDLVRKYSNQ